MGYAAEVEIEGIEELRRRLAADQRQIPFAHAMALSRLARDVQQAIRGHMVGIFDNPIAFTLNSIRIKPASKKDLSAYVWIRDEATKGTAPVKYLMPQALGSRRNMKRHERALQYAGVIPRGWGTVPGRDARLNRAGNITSGTYTRILSQLKASPDPMQNATQGKAKPYFVMRKGDRPIGIYQRTSKRRIKSILHFVKELPDYGPELKFQGVADKVIRRRSAQRLEEAISRALETAR